MLASSKMKGRCFDLLTDNKNNHKRCVPYISRSELVLAVSLGCFNLALLAILSTVWKFDIAFLTIAVALVYLAEIAVIGFRHKENAEFSDCDGIYDFLSQKSSSVFRNTKTPVIAFDAYGTILWCNDSMRKIIPEGINPIDKNISEFLGFDVGLGADESSPIVYEERLYTTEGFAVTEKDNGLYLLMLNDITVLSDYKRKYKDERVAVAYIMIDNVEDVLQYTHEKYSDAIARVDFKLKEWADSVDGIIKSYDADKYVMFFDSVHLDEVLESRFAILDDIRGSRVGDGMSVTVSIGVSKVEGSLRDRESNARDAIDMALQRGGDQAVYKTDSSIEYYGGRTKSVYKRTNVRSRTFTAELTAAISRADNVIIMGHRYGDFDSFGASIGVARLALLCGTKANIAVDLRDKNLLPCIQLMQKNEEYSQTFVDNAEGLDLIGPDTLVVIVDVGSLSRAQFPDIAVKVDNVAVIDHHRKVEELPDSVKYSYIDPTASSACELVGEMLENAISSQSLMKEEADMLLSGVLLDTKQFTRNTGTRTFAVAKYLRGAGASPTDVYNLFKTTPQELSKEARFHTSITTYRDRFAISSCDGETDESYRIIASKAADKMLSLQGIDAAFALVRIGDQIHISGRSNGTVNVQLILEKLHGGGHFDVAGAQVVSDSVLSVLETLKSSIDDYIEL